MGEATLPSQEMPLPGKEF